MAEAPWPAAFSSSRPRSRASCRSTVRTSSASAPTARPLQVEAAVGVAARGEEQQRPRGLRRAPRPPRIVNLLTGHRGAGRRARSRARRRPRPRASERSRSQQPGRAARHCALEPEGECGDGRGVVELASSAPAERRAVRPRCPRRRRARPGSASLRPLGLEDVHELGGVARARPRTSRWRSAPRRPDRTPPRAPGRRRPAGDSPSSSFPDGSSSVRAPEPGRRLAHEHQLAALDGDEHHRRAGVGSAPRPRSIARWSRGASREVTCARRRHRRRGRRRLDPLLARAARLGRRRPLRARRPDERLDLPFRRPGRAAARLDQPDAG